MGKCTARPYSLFASWLVEPEWEHPHYAHSLHLISFPICSEAHESIWNRNYLKEKKKKKKKREEKSNSSHFCTAIKNNSGKIKLRKMRAS